ncbi:hypothetical protein SAMN04488055_2494 [Chitinophaga niabensis]|uniref:Uncharacterized protein n=1 Tax=Chitinophaga niabensis TaxID=536979 RepID=A0A1N6FZE9_9BACT|nr:hypothetical protein SAMN04488055_2494 [Chitinophaga niabensis]
MTNACQDIGDENGNAGIQISLFKHEGGMD